MEVSKKYEKLHWTFGATYDNETLYQAKTVHK